MESLVRPVRVFHSPSVIHDRSCLGFTNPGGWPLAGHRTRCAPCASSWCSSPPPSPDSSPGNRSAPLPLPRSPMTPRRTAPPPVTPPSKAGSLALERSDFSSDLRPLLLSLESYFRSYTKMIASEQVIENGYWVFLDMASGRYLWRAMKER